MRCMDHGFIDIRFRINFSHHASNTRFYIPNPVSLSLLHASVFRGIQAIAPGWFYQLPMSIEDFNVECRDPSFHCYGCTESNLSLDEMKAVSV